MPKEHCTTGALNQFVNQHHGEGRWLKKGIDSWAGLFIGILIVAPSRCFESFEQCGHAFGAESSCRHVSDHQSLLLWVVDRGHHFTECSQMQSQNPATQVWRYYKQTYLSNAPIVATSSWSKRLTASLLRQSTHFSCCFACFMFASLELVAGRDKCGKHKAPKASFSGTYISQSQAPVVAQENAYCRMLQF